MNHSIDVVLLEVIALRTGDLRASATLDVSIDVGAPRVDPSLLPASVPLRRAIVPAAPPEDTEARAPRRNDPKKLAFAFGGFLLVSVPLFVASNTFGLGGVEAHFATMTPFAWI